MGKRARTKRTKNNHKHSRSKLSAAEREAYKLRTAEEQVKVEHDPNDPNCSCPWCAYWSENVYVSEEDDGAQEVTANTSTVSSTELPETESAVKLPYSTTELTETQNTNNI